MNKVLSYSLLLVAGLLGSQYLPAMLGDSFGPVAFVVRVLTMFCLAFIMIHVGYEFEIDKSNLGRYAVDYGVAATAAAFPWIFCAVYFVFMFSPAEDWWALAAWKDSLLAARFAAPTSAGVLFSMLAAAGLSATWLFGKARILAIFDDLDTVLLMIPLKMLIVGIRWQLGVVIVIMAVMLWMAWRWLHAIRIPISWPWVLGYAGAITLVSELIYLASKQIDDVVPIHIEVLLPAFVLGCILARPAGNDPHIDDAREGHQEGPESPDEQRVSSIISGVFMVLVGLSMPALALASSSAPTPAGESVVGASGASAAMPSGWGVIWLHVLLITLLSNLGKMFPLFFYRDESHWRERLALCVGMWPRGEVGAGVLVISLGYGISETLVTVAGLSLAVNLLLTGVFIWIVKKLLSGVTQGSPVPVSADHRP